MHQGHFSENGRGDNLETVNKEPATNRYAVREFFKVYEGLNRNQRYSNLEKTLGTGGTGYGRSNWPQISAGSIVGMKMLEGRKGSQYATE